jgi:hypothetical protein
MIRFPSAGAPDPASHTNTDKSTGGGPSVATRLIRIVLVMGGIAGAIVATVAIALPGSGHANNTPSTQTSLAARRAGAQRTAANKQWAEATCTNILAWKKEIARDESGLLSLKALSRVNDAIAATKRMLATEDRLGLPPGATTALARTEANRLRTEIDSHLTNIEKAASSVASGNIAAIGTLVTELQNDKSLAPQTLNELRHVLTADLGLSLAETSSCRQLVGIPI